MPRRGRSAVVDVGGGSTELVVRHPGGRASPGRRRCRVGSGLLADRYLRGDPPGDSELAAVGDARRRPSSRASTRRRSVGGAARSAAAPRASLRRHGRRPRPRDARAGARGGLRRSCGRRRPAAATCIPSACACCPPACSLLDAARAALGVPLPHRGRRPARGSAPGQPGTIRGLMAKAAPVEIAGELPYAEAAARTVARARRTSCSSTPRACSTPPTSSASTTCASRAAGCAPVLEIFEPCFDRRRLRPVLRDVKRLADALGARRDPDVQLAWLAELEGVLGGAERPGRSDPGQRAARRAGRRATRCSPRRSRRPRRRDLRARLLALADSAHPRAAG